MSSLTARFEEFVLGAAAADPNLGGDDLRADIAHFGIRTVVAERMWMGRDDWDDLARWYLNRKKVPAWSGHSRGDLLGG
jgi:hypothetical protein